MKGHFVLWRHFCQDGFLGMHVPRGLQTLFSSGLGCSRSPLMGKQWRDFAGIVLLGVLLNASSRPKGKVGNMHNQTCGTWTRYPALGTETILPSAPGSRTVPGKRTAPTQRLGDAGQPGGGNQSLAGGGGGRASAILHAACPPRDKNRVRPSGLGCPSRKPGCSCETTLSPKREAGGTGVIPERREENELIG